MSTNHPAPELVIEDMGLDELAGSLEELRETRTQVAGAIFLLQRELDRRGNERGAKRLETENWQIDIDRPPTYLWILSAFEALCASVNVDPEQAIKVTPARAEVRTVDTNRALAMGRRYGVAFEAELESCYTKVPGEPAIKLKRKTRSSK